MAQCDSIGWQKGRIADPLASLLVHPRGGASRPNARPRSPWIPWWPASPAATIEGGTSRGVYEFGRPPRQITQDELAFAAERAARVRLEDDRTLLHVLPQDFNVDGRAGYRNPRGMTCSRLEANVYILTIASQEHDGLITAVHHAHSRVEETVFEPIADGVRRRPAGRPGPRRGCARHRAALLRPDRLRRRCRRPGRQHPALRRTTSRATSPMA